MSEPVVKEWPQDRMVGRAILRSVSDGLAAADASTIMAGVGEVAFTFEPARDIFCFDHHAVELFGVDSLADITTGTAFLMRIGREFRDARRSAVVPPSHASDGSDRNYTVIYRFQSHAGAASAADPFIEEQAAWTRDHQGRTVARGVMRIVTDRYHAAQKLLDRAERDQLTGVFNRTTLHERLAHSIEHSRKARRPCALLIAGVSGLGTTNETFGLEIGDEILVAVARILKRHIRGIDHIGRYSSNKFAIVLNDCGPGTMRIVADRLMDAVAKTAIETSVSKLNASVRIGGVSLPEYATTPEAAMIAATKALDRARRKRLDSFVAYEPRPEEDNLRRRNASLADAMMSALDENRMSLELQPMVAARSGAPDHYECLLRMIRPDGTMITAGDFMPVAEQLGIVRLLDFRAQELAIGLLKSYPTAHLSLNVSGLTAADNEWLVSLHRLTQGKRHVLERLTVEITETAAIHDLQQSISFVETIKELGCKVAIDDFGVGYTNFRNLKALQADLVKIDGAFIQNVCHDAGDQAFVRAMVELARAFGMQTVAEFVGDDATAEYLRIAGIDFLQGYHFGAPADPRKLLGPPVGG
ncbi:MAG: bifunctional diguanylate cyclase/phosphodiesterase [Hyphomicrobium aestuarii]|nr:bifunctional diguanylate cyclase/phosphodiesterase [Hyphomicrobium aestuarii]